MLSCKGGVVNLAPGLRGALGNNLKMFTVPKLSNEYFSFFLRKIIILNQQVDQQFRWLESQSKKLLQPRRRLTPNIDTCGNILNVSRHTIDLFL